MVSQEERHTGDPKDGNRDVKLDDALNIHHLLNVLAKRKMIILGLCLISVISTAFVCSILPPIYRLEIMAKLSMPKNIMTVKELPTAKDVALIVGNIDGQKKAMIFPKNGEEISDAKIVEIRGASEKLKMTIDSRNPEILPAAMQEFVEYLGNIRDIKITSELIRSEIEAKIESVNEAVKKNDLQIRELEKRLSSSKILPVGFNPVEINNKVVELKMEKYRLEQERRNYKPIQLLEEPFISNSPIKPRKAMIIAIAAMASLLFGIMLAFVAEYRERAKSR